MHAKEVKKLAEKKYRLETGLFMVEGEKNIRELLDSSFQVEEFFGTALFLNEMHDALKTYTERRGERVEITQVREEELVRIGTFQSNNAGIAVVRMREPISVEAVCHEAEKNIVLALDDVRDPGNLGTIMRIADWYGVTRIVASLTTVDMYNPKVVAATMGSFTRVEVLYAELKDVFMKAREQKSAIMGAVMDGVSTHEVLFPQNGFLVMGSESHGVSAPLAAYLTHQVTIPRFGTAESLNVSVATGILLDTLRRNT